MLVVSGKRACGKTETGKIAAEHGFAVYDAGPALRAATQQHNLAHGTDFDAEGFILDRMAQTNNVHWGTDFDAENIAKLTPDEAAHRVALIGYRSYHELQLCTSALSILMNRPVEARILHLETNYDQALQFYIEREGIADREAAHQRLSTQHTMEVAWGIDDMRTHADFLIENSASREELHQTVSNIIGGLLSESEMTLTIDD